MQLKGHMQITRALHPVIFKMQLLHTAPHNGIQGMYTMCSVTL